MQNMREQWSNSYLFGSNSDFIEELYELYLANPAHVDDKWRKYFDSLQDGGDADVNHHEIRERFAILTSNPLVNASSGEVMSSLQTSVYGLIAAYRAWGHKFAKLDPLEREVVTRPQELDYKKYGLGSELESEFFNDYDLSKAKKVKLKEIIAYYENIYCGSCGFEFAYISEPQEQSWVRDYIENNYPRFKLDSDEKKQILQKLTEAEGLERFLHTKYVGQKRFSLEGGESLIPMLDRVINKAAATGVSDVYLGMAHRGRLNALVNIAGKSPQKLIDEFDGNYPHYDFVTSGDVKYHKGYACEYVTTSGKKVKTSIAYNPSHLEAVNPVIQGMVRAHQDTLVQNKQQVLGVLVHGDAALIGLGTNQAVYTMSATRAYGGLGMIHITVNNQVGFTTSRRNDTRSSRYCTDIAKMVESPVIHVNGDDMAAAIFACDLAVNYRQKFAKDIMIDLICFRRHGHNESDDPTLTQPLMYVKVKQHPGIRGLFAKQLINEGIISEEDEKNLIEDYRGGLLKGKHIAAKQMVPLPRYPFEIKAYLKAAWQDEVKTAISKSKLADLVRKITAKPGGEFKLHPTVVKLIDSRIAMASGTQGVDYGMAETLAYAALLDEGISIRLTGEDIGRGTFTHRHAAWHDMARKHLSEGIYYPLKNAENKSWFEIYDSILNEEGVLGFEYGYSLGSVSSLVLWEAQFGDFANGAQVIIDQFIASGEAKWGNLSRLVLMLPHGFEGQGPEHSSARLERFLQLAAENNIQVVVPSTSAQMFHLLRKQAKSNYLKPLVIFMSKKLLRFPAALSNIDEVLHGSYKFVIGDDKAQKSAQRVIVCSGPVYYDLVNARADNKQVDKVAIIRVEQLYPFPSEFLKAQLAKYTKAKTFVWAQEEPYNQGAWLQIREELDNCLDAKEYFIPATRPRAAAPATGYLSMHTAQLQQLLTDAFNKKA